MPNMIVPNPTVQPTTPELQHLHTHMVKTYFVLRRGLAYIAIGFPLLLWWGGAFVGIELKGSMSAYYHSPMRNFFVGLLFAVGLCLYLYKGFSNKENIILNLAGAFAVGVALFPTGESQLHGPCALLLFACMFYVSWFTHGDTVKYILDEKRAALYRRTYKILAFAMFACPAIAAVLIGLLAWDTEHKGFLFAVELGGIWAFAAYWLVKSREIERTREDAAKAAAQLPVQPQPELVAPPPDDRISMAPTAGPPVARLPQRRRARDRRR
ncbi:hypothetical protein ACLESO_13990 [Pyxidicoccus sp. 3LG]